MIEIHYFIKELFYLKKLSNFFITFVCCRFNIVSVYCSAFSAKICMKVRGTHLADISGACILSLLSVRKSLWHFIDYSA